MNPHDREDIMRQWDAWVEYYKSGGGGSWPRDAFEALIDHFYEKVDSTGDVHKTTAILEWSLNVECPFCNREIDLTMENDYLFSGRTVFKGHWGDLNIKISCSFCNNEFILDNVEI